MVRVTTAAAIIMAIGVGNRNRAAPKITGNL